MAADLKDIRDLYSHDTAEWKPIRDEGTTDMRYAAGDPWDPNDRLTRLNAKRLCLSADELSQYVNQVVNEVRANKRAVKFTPIGNGANDDTAKFYADKMREIEYRSRAPIAYTTAFENCVSRSFGFVRVNTRYQHARAVHQDLWIDPVPNPNLITPDSMAQMPDLSDMGHCWVRESWSREEFNQKWTKNRVDRFTSDLGKLAGDWVSESRVFVGEYWKIQIKKRTLLIVQPEGATEPIGIFEDELQGQPLPGPLVGTRKVEDPSVIQQLTNGLDILEENQWPGKYIPIIGCLGKVLYVAESGSEKRKILSMIRLAREPQMLLAFLLTAEAETIGMMTKFPYFAYEGQLSQTSLNDIARSNHEPVAVVLVKPTVEGVPPGTVLPHPQRNPWSLELSSYEMVKESTRRSIQAAMGQTPLPTAAQRRNEKSGVALKHIDELGQRGSFHFTDHYLDMITHVGCVCEDLIDKIYKNVQDTGIRKDDDSAEIVRINDPNDEKSISTKGDYLVTVSTGPSFDSEREAATDFADTVIDSPILTMLGPEKAPKIIALAIKLKNLGTLGDQMAEIVSPSPPKEGEPPSEQQLQQAVEEAQGQVQQLGQALQGLQQIIDTEEVKAQRSLAETQAKIQADDVREQAKIQAENQREGAKLQISTQLEAKKIDAQERQSALDNLVKLAIAEMQQDTALSREHGEQAREQLGFQHEHQESERDRQIQTSEAERDRTTQMTEAERDRQASQQQQSEAGA